MLPGMKTRNKQNPSQGLTLPKKQPFLLEKPFWEMQTFWKARPGRETKPFWEVTLAKVVSHRPGQQIIFRKAIKCCKGCVREGWINEKQFCLVWGNAQAT